MNALILNPHMRKAIFCLPEIWYTLFFVSAIIGTSSYLFRTGWDTSNAASVLFYIGIISLLVRQILRANGWVSVIMGALFALGSCYMSLALLSEYREFPLGTEPEAIRMVTVGGLLIGTSLLLSIAMLMKGIRQIQSREGETANSSSIK